MPIAKLISPATRQVLCKLCVAAYCRVSSNSADQKNSFATQERVYRKRITENPDWELVDIFADEGLSGMKADTRPEFQRMIRMCELQDDYSVKDADEGFDDDLDEDAGPSAEDLAAIESDSFDD